MPKLPPKFSQRENVRSQLWQRVRSSGLRHQSALSLPQIQRMLDQFNAGHQELFLQLAMRSKIVEREIRRRGNTITAQRYIIQMLDDSEFAEVSNTDALRHHGTMAASDELLQLQRENASARQLVLALRKQLRDALDARDTHTKDDADPNGVLCNICFMEITDTLIRHPGCTGVFHRDCLHQWIALRQTETRLCDCPCCRQDINEYMMATSTIRSVAAPYCKDCGLEMTLRTNMSSGSRFWGCPNYFNTEVKCRVTINVPGEKPCQQ